MQATAPIASSLVLCFAFTACQSPEEPGATTGEAISSGRPHACRIVTAGPLANGPGVAQTTYGQQPTYRGDLTTPLGDPVLADSLRVRLDAATTPGTYDLSRGGSNCYEKSAQCVIVVQDVDAATGAAAKTFAAVRGQVEVSAEKTPDQRQGRLRRIELREVTITPSNTPWRAAELVSGGECLWVEELAFDTRRPDGCDPRKADSCGTGKACIPDNAAGSDGTCRAATGAKATGEACTTDENNASDCAAGHRCIDPGGGGAICVKTCDLLAAQPGCGEGTMCGSFGLCRTATPTDPAKIGETCTMDGAKCGSEGARGTCFELFTPAGVPWDKGLKCWGFERARSACRPGEDLGYQSFSSGRDRSLGICTTKL